jgi:hypothetical protein
MERIGEQEQRVGEAGLSRGEHSSLPAAVRVPAEKNACANCWLCAQHFDGAANALLVAFSKAARWAVRTQLPKRKIAAENGQA